MADTIAAAKPPRVELRGSQRPQTTPISTEPRISRCRCASPSSAVAEPAWDRVVCCSWISKCNSDFINNGKPDWQAIIAGEVP